MRTDVDAADIERAVVKAIYATFDRTKRRRRQPQVGADRAALPSSPVGLTAGTVIRPGGVVERTLVGGLAGPGGDVEHVGRRVGDVGRCRVITGRSPEHLGGGVDDLASLASHLHPLVGAEP